MKKLYIIKCAVITALSAGIISFFRLNESPYFLQISVLLSLFVLLFDVYCMVRVNGELFSPAILFLASFYVFQNGQLLLRALNIEFHDYYINLLPEFIDPAAYFSSLSNLAAGLAGVITAREKRKIKRKEYIMDSYTPSMVCRAALFGLGATGLIAVPVLMIKFFRYALPGGYYAVRAYEDTLPQIIFLAEYLFPVFAVLFLVYSDSKREKLFINTLIICWSGITALCGDRTTGIAGILCVFVVPYLRSDDKKKKRKNTLRIIIIGICMMALVKIAFLFRTQQGISSSGEGIVVNFMTELGFSCFPLFMMMEVVPAFEPFQYGRGYILSALSGLLPSSLDFTGIIAELTADQSIYNTWIDKYFNFDFGVGFSLNAEAYINFGFYGPIMIFLLCLIVLYNLSTDINRVEDGKRYSIYKASVLLFIWFTMPRRSSYYIWNAIFWSILMIKLYLMGVYALKNRFNMKRRR